MSVDNGQRRRNSDAAAQDKGSVTVMTLEDEIDALTERINAATKNFGSKRNRLSVRYPTLGGTTKKPEST